MSISINILNNTNKKVLKKYEEEEYFIDIFKNNVTKIKEKIIKIDIKKSEKNFLFFKKNVIFMI